MASQRIARFALAMLASLVVAAASAHENHTYLETQAMSLEELGSPPPDPSNRWADHLGAAALGEPGGSALT